MPTYEYACTTCGERTEAKQSFTDPPLEECPICGGKLRKLYSPVGIVFKGSGFYSTDAKKRPSEAASSKDEKPQKTAKSSDGKGGDSPAPKKEAKKETSS
ncbi:MAG: FmdB family zinc ribbon protein [Actinomycetota bacterium]